MQFIDCTYQGQAIAILDIFNEAIANSTALYDYHPRDLSFMGEWFAIKQDKDFPVIGAIDDGGELLGFATYGTFRERAAYKYSIEHSVYVRSIDRGRGIGKALLSGLIDRAREQQYHTIIGGIDIENQASIALHEGLGFQRAGVIAQAGYKFDRWLDLVFYQLILDTPTHPIDG
jgi:L-amino acid N-acyltransferase